ncbi:MAG TPA: YraN family protein [Steroidobacteraceae bacterium]|nr:YraN family protein [Steroidobacteraceae bacterium]
MDDRLRKEAGRAGEAAALAYLQRAGLQLLLRNFRCKSGEIDLVMLDGTTLALVEVRYRSSEQFGGAAASVTWRKQHRLIHAAEYLLLAHSELRRYPARFDVVAISTAPQYTIDWIKGAFNAGNDG